MSAIKSTLWLPTNELLTLDLDSNYQILPNFKVWEIANNKTTDEIKLVIPNARAWKLLLMLQTTRDRFGSMDLGSCYRTEEYNSRPDVGGDPNSCHLVTWAFDWDESFSSAEYNTVTDWWRRLCQNAGEIGAIDYYNWGVHCEIGSDIRFGATSFKIRDYR